MVRHTVLWKIIGTYLAAAVTGPHLTAPGGSDLGVLPSLLRLVELASQDLHGPILVLILAPLVLTLHHRTGGQVRNADGGLCLVDVLPACTAGAEGVDLQILGVDGELRLLRLRHHRHRSSGGLDTSAGFRLRHPLHPVGTGLEFQPGPRSVALHRGTDLLHAAQLRDVLTDDLQLPAPALGVHGVHPQQVRRKQSALLAADTAPNLQNHTFFIVGVSGQQQALQLLGQPLPLLLGPCQLLLGQLPQLRVRQHLPCLCDGLLRPL